MRIGRRRADAPLDSSIDNRHTRTATLKGELNDKDGVLRKKSDKHDERNLQVHIVGYAIDSCKYERGP